MNSIQSSSDQKRKLMYAEHYLESDLKKSQLSSIFPWTPDSFGIDFVVKAKENYCITDSYKSYFPPDLRVVQDKVFRWQDKRSRTTTICSEMMSEGVIQLAT